MCVETKKNPLKIEIDASYQERMSQYREQREQVERSLRHDPTMPAKLRAMAEARVQQQVLQLDEVVGEVERLIKKLKKHVPDVLDASHLVAAYLLLGRSLRSTHAMCALARAGFHYEAMELIRSVNEAVGLVTLFLDPALPEAQLSRWFRGDIVKNEQSRASLGAFVNQAQDDAEEKFPIEKVAAGVYAGWSRYTHSAHAAILDSYDPFLDDFDFEGTSGFHYLADGGVQSIRESMQSVLISVKHFCGAVGDMALYEETNGVLLRFFPEMGDDARNEKVIRDGMEKYKS